MKKTPVFPLTITMLTILAGVAFAGPSKEGTGVADSYEIKVFIVQSHEKDHVCGSPQDRGIEASLTKE